MAATASVAEPPKNVRITCASAERDADSRERVGRYTYFVPICRCRSSPFVSSIRIMVRTAEYEGGSDRLARTSATEASPS